MRTAGVALGPRSYDIYVGSGLFDSILDCIPMNRQAWDRAVLLTDSNVGPLYADSLQKRVETLGPVHQLTVPAGEASKSWDVAGRLLEDLAALKVRRHDVLFTLGGGMISDLGGFVASTYLRGISVVHLPTSLLGQVDAAIGGKTGVNLSVGKNLAGTFYQPSAVLCDVDTLLTLPDREFRSGLAEVVKYGLCFEPEILSLLGEGQVPGHPVKDQGGGAGTPLYLNDPHVSEELVWRCAKIKAGVVSADETDRSDRILLNYGHTFGHALEAAGGFKTWSHGEAISIGMLFAAKLAETMGLSDSGLEATHRRVLEEAGLPVKAAFDPDEVERLWQMDKKRETRQRWVLLRRPGDPVVRSDVEDHHVRVAMKAVLAG